MLNVADLLGLLGLSAHEAVGLVDGGTAVEHEALADCNFAHGLNGPPRSRVSSSRAVTVHPVCTGRHAHRWPTGRRAT